MGRIRYRTLTAVIAGAAALAQAPVFRVDVKLVRLTATVKDARGQPVGSLNKSEFQVFDNGIRQEIAVFERHTAQPLSIALLVDTSGSTGKDLKYETDSVSRFLRALFREGNPGDALALFSFNWEVRRLTAFTRNTERLERNLKQLRSEAGTSMYDAIFLASGELEEREGRRVVVMVTDGGDTVSSKTYQDALRSLHGADAVFYAVLVMPIANDAGRNIGGENALATLALSTGGKVFAPSLGAGLDAAFDEILRDLRTQYLLGFYPKGVPLTREPFHRIEIRTARPDLRVVSRSGYYGDFERQSDAEGRPGPLSPDAPKSKDESSRADPGRKQVPGAAGERTPPGLRSLEQ